MQYKKYTDQMGRQVSIPLEPRRIISVVPSQTELLAGLGAEEQLAGITKFCIHPEHVFRSKTRVGGTKTLNLEKIRSLQPDLIIANKEENTQEQIETLAAEFPLWISDIYDLDTALEMISCVGEITGRSAAASQIVHEIREGFSAFSQIREKPLSVAYFIWKDPLISVGADTFIHHMLDRCGMRNVFADRKRYPEISAEELQAAQPDHIFLSSEPYPFKEKHILEFKAHCPSSHIELVDGEMFSWYGSRLRQAPAYLANLLKNII